MRGTDRGAGSGSSARRASAATRSWCPNLASEDPARGLGDYADTIELFDGGRMVDDQGRSYWGDREATISIMYDDLERADACWAFERLRPQAQRSQGEPSPAPPAGLRTESIVGANDRVVSPAWSRRVARERLGVEPVELPTGHFPMITHPGLLAEGLSRLAAA